MSCYNKQEQRKLLLAVRLGDDDACAELLRMYSPLTSSLVSSTMSSLPRTADIDEDELRQEAAIKLYQAALSYDLESEISFGLYAKICVKNRMISLLRRFSLDTEHSTVEMPDEVLFEDDSEDPSETILRIEQEQELDKRIKTVLSPLEYDVFNLYIDGSRPTEIAEMLKISVKTAENAVYRMKTKLQKLFH